MGRQVVRRVLWIGGAALAVVGAAVTTYWLSVGSPPMGALIFNSFSRKELGGSWELLIQTSSFDSGYQAFVARRHGIASRKIVGRFVAQAIYLGADCVSFESSDMERSHVYYAACEDRLPVELSSTTGQGVLSDHGLEQTSQDGVRSLLTPAELIRLARSQSQGAE